MSDKQPLQPDLTNVLDNLKSDILKSINCIKIGTVQSFDNANQTVTVKISIKKIQQINEDGSRILQEYPLLLECPCVVLKGGTASLRMPIQKDDGCVVLFNDRDIDNWFVAGDGQAPNTYRTHDLSDGIALVGLGNLTNILEDYLNDQVTLQFDADNKIELKSGRINVQSPEVYIGEADFEYIVKSTKMKDWVKDEINSVFNGHTHPIPAEAKAVNPVGVTPVAAPNETMSDPSDSDIASEAHKVGD